MAAKHLASPSVSLITFWGTPFLEKGAPKITEGGPFDPHWPISRINPAICISWNGFTLCGSRKYPYIISFPRKAFFSKPHPFSNLTELHTYIISLYFFLYLVFYTPPPPQTSNFFLWGHYGDVFELHIESSIQSLRHRTNLSSICKVALRSFFWNHNGPTELGEVCFEFPSVLICK